MRSVKIKINALLMVGLCFFLNSFAHAQFMKCEKLSADEQTQADFCSAHPACQIAVSLMKSCADTREFVVKFFQGTKGKSQEELARLPAADEVDNKPKNSEYVDKFNSPKEIEFRKKIARDYEKEDQALSSQMRNLNCVNPRSIDAQQCSDIGVQALRLQKNVAMHNASVKTPRSPMAPDFIVDSLQTQGLVSQDGGNFIVYANSEAKIVEPSPKVAEALTSLPRRERGYGDKLFEATLDKAARGESIDQLTVAQQIPEDTNAGNNNKIFLEILGGVAQGILQYKASQIGQQNALLAQQQAIASSNAAMQRRNEMANASRRTYDNSNSPNDKVPGQRQTLTEAGSVSGNSGDAACKQKVDELDRELGQRSAAIPSNDNVQRLSLVHKYALRMSQAWQPCNAAAAKENADVAASTLATCRQIASASSMCGQ